MSFLDRHYLFLMFNYYWNQTLLFFMLTCVLSGACKSRCLFNELGEIWNYIWSLKLMLIWLNLRFHEICYDIYFLQFIGMFLHYLECYRQFYHLNIVWYYVNFSKMLSNTLSVVQKQVNEQKSKYWNLPLDKQNVSY